MLRHFQAFGTGLGSILAENNIHSKPKNDYSHDNFHPIYPRNIY